MVRSTAKTMGTLISSLLVLTLVLVVTTTVYRFVSSGAGDGSAQVLDPDIAAGRYFSIVLKPEVSSSKPQPFLVHGFSIPALELKGAKIPLRIKFDGYYWIFRGSIVRPLQNAEVLNVLPDEAGFHSTDGTSLVMEAYQTFSDRLDLTCCSSIEVSVRDNDEFPMTIELIVSDLSSRTNFPLTPSLSLGQSKIAASGSIKKKMRGVTLNFPVPASPSLSSFNQMTFRFYPEFNRRTISPKIAIEEITLNPK